MSNEEKIVGSDAGHYYRMCLAKKRWQEGWQKRALDLISRHHASGDITSVLEIGCGVADIVPHLPEALTYTGLDPVQYCIAEARGQYPKHRFVQGFAGSMPFEDSQFDLALSCQTIQSFEDPRRSLVDMARVVRPGGYVLIIAPNLETPWSRINGTRHYTRARQTVLTLKRFGDLVLRFIGIPRFRIIPESYLEATGRYEKGDDGLKYVASTWEVHRLFRNLGFEDVVVRTTTVPLLRLLPATRYHGGGMFLFMRKQLR